MLVAAFGLISLTYLNVKPLEVDEVTALLFPPTISIDKINSALLKSDLEVRNIRWRGRLVEIDVSKIDEDRRKSIARELAIFSIQISIRPTILCIQPDSFKDAR